ncbi:hypothetical protein LCGC14_1523270 [marine sediment metagenome]|uniref:Uncharacterized protein n=1 Tax=marine sediment metagenome TaxID=412755 RepID=A0A0F9JIZ4_9ZZZZ
MTIKHLGAATRGGLITSGQDDKENTSNDLDDLNSDAMNATSTLDVTAGGTFNLNTPQGNLDTYLGSSLVRITGTPGAAVTIIVPDGATGKRIAFANETSQNATINTVTGATPTVSVPASAVKRLQVRGIEFTVTADDADATGALLADGTIPATGPFVWADKELARASLKDYSEEKFVAVAAATIDLDAEDGNVHEVEMDQDTTFTFSNPSPTGSMSSFTVILKQDSTGGWDPTWPASVDWENGTPPVVPTAANSRHMFSFMTVDAGTIHYGFLGGLSFA